MCNNFWWDSWWDSCCIRDVVLSGAVSNASGPVSGFPIEYTVNCRTLTTTTDANGRYTITALRGACVVISTGMLVGVRVSPENYSFTACFDRANLDFTLTQVTAPFTISGAVSGLPSVQGITVFYAVDGVNQATTTDAGGNYAFAAFSGANVMITPSIQTGFVAAPPSYSIPSVSMNVPGNNFTYTAIP